METKKKRFNLICQNEKHFLECQRILIKKGFYINFSPDDEPYSPNYLVEKNGVLICDEDSVKWCYENIKCEHCEQKCFENVIKSENFINEYRTKKLGRILNENVRK